RMLRRLIATDRAAVEAAAAELGRVLAVVLADAEDVAPWRGYRCLHHMVSGKQRRAAVGGQGARRVERRGSRPDQLQHGRGDACTGEIDDGRVRPDEADAGTLLTGVRNQLHEDLGQ